MERKAPRHFRICCFGSCGTRSVGGLETEGQPGTAEGNQGLQGTGEEPQPLRIRAGGRRPEMPSRSTFILQPDLFHTLSVHTSIFFFHVAFICVFFPPPAVMENRCSPCEEADLHRWSQSVRTFLHMGNMRLLFLSALLKICRGK